MEMEMRVLRAKIRGLEVESGLIRRKINQTSGVRRNAYWELKRELGLRTRAYLIAYGLLRGIPYEKIEGKSRKTSALPILVHDAIIESTCTWNHAKWPLSRVRDLLATRETETPSPAEKDVPGTSQEPLAKLIGRVSVGSTFKRLVKRIV